MRHVSIQGSSPPKRVLKPEGFGLPWMRMDELISLFVSQWSKSSVKLSLLPVLCSLLCFFDLYSHSSRTDPLASSTGSNRWPNFSLTWTPLPPPVVPSSCIPPTPINIKNDTSFHGPHGDHCCLSKFQHFDIADFSFWLLFLMILTSNAFSFQNICMYFVKRLKYVQW